VHARILDIQLKCIAGREEKQRDCVAEGARCDRPVIASRACGATGATCGAAGGTCGAAGAISGEAIYF